MIIRVRNYLKLLLLIVNLFCVCLSGFSTSSTINVQNNTDKKLFVAKVFQTAPTPSDSASWLFTNDTINEWNFLEEVIDVNPSSMSTNDYTEFHIYLLMDGNSTDTLKLHAEYDKNFIGVDVAGGFSMYSNAFTYYSNSAYQQTITINGDTFTVKLKVDTDPVDFSQSVFFAIQQHKTYSINPSDFNNKNILNVIAYNIKMMPVLTGNFSERGTEIPTQYSPWQDVVINEELFDNGARTNYLTPGMISAGFTHYTTVLNSGAITLVNGGVMIYSKWPIETQADFAFSACNNNSGDCYATKGVKYARINKLGKKYHIFGTHLDAGSDTADYEVRKIQYGELKNFISSLNIPDDEPVIWGGDMNVSPLSDRNEYILAIDSLNPIIPVYTGYNTSKMENPKPNKVIDHLWGSSVHQIPAKAAVCVFSLRSITDPMWNIWDYSDHRPVNGRFEFPDVTVSDTTSAYCINDSLHIVASPSVSGNWNYLWYKNGVFVVFSSTVTPPIVISSLADAGNYSATMAYHYSSADTSALNILLHPAPKGNATYYDTTQISNSVAINAASCTSSVLENTGSLGEINIYPNPSSSGFIQFTLNAHFAETATIQIIDATGRILFHEREILENEMHTKALNVSFLPTGFYLLRAVSENQDKVQKHFVIQR